MTAAPAPAPSAGLRAEFGEIDIYLFDQLLRGRFDHRRRVLDAGCGSGRNLRYLLRRGYECFGIDRDAHAIADIRRLAADIAPSLAAGNFQQGDIDRLPWADGVMDAVISSAVLHFAADVAHFDGMMAEMWRVLAPGGLLFARLASNVGLEDRIGSARRRVRLPDGSERFIVDESMLMEWTARARGQLLDPIKTTVVQGQRCMTTWCMRKPQPLLAE